MLGRSVASSFSYISLHELMLLNSLSTWRGSVQNIPKGFIGTGDEPPYSRM